MSRDNRMFNFSSSVVLSANGSWLCEAWLDCSKVLLKLNEIKITNLTTDNIPPRLANAVLSVAENYKK